MPTYEYACKDCGQHLEIVQSFSEDPLTTCAACGGRLRKVFSAAGIIFKGSGYYVTDSRASQKKAGAAAGSKTESSSESGSGSESGPGSDSKSGADSKSTSSSSSDAKSA